LIIESILYI